MKITKLKNQKITIFDSVEEALRKIETSQYNPHIPEANRISNQEHSVVFTQTRSLKEAICLARTGWDKGENIITALTKQYFDAFNKLFPQQDWSKNLNPDVAGEVINMEAVLSNQPETMLHFQDDYEKTQKLSSAKMQRIIVNIAVNSNINSDSIFNRGSIVTSMINCMELSGFRTELWICDFTATIRTNNPYQCKYYFRIKSFDEDLNLKKFSFAVCHPSMLRRVCFALYEQEPEDEILHGMVNKSYGTSINMTPDEIKNFAGELQYGNIYFELLDHNMNFNQLLVHTKTKIRDHFLSIKVGDIDVDLSENF